MAPFVGSDGTLKMAEQVIQDLGNFSDIRIPAKCAARIGQNFTDTNTSVTLSRNEVFDLQEITRYGYDFADGAGTISQTLLNEVCHPCLTRYVHATLPSSETALQTEIEVWQRYLLTLALHRRSGKYTARNAY